MEAKIESDKSPITPIHQWTNGGDRVRLVKCVNADGISYDGFQWPSSGSVKPKYCSRTPDCTTGGLFGWPWGIGIGAGKEPDYTGRWIVFSAPPDQVILVDPNENPKAKVAMDSSEKVDARVEYYGDWWGAMAAISSGRDAWILHAASGAASNTGYSGAASNTGYSGAASNTGDSGAASNTGDRGAASNTGDSGAASNTGDSGAASNTGYSGAAYSTGYSAVASSTGESAVASSTGESGVASSTGYSGVASSTGYSAVASSTGYSAAASSTGCSAVASSTGGRGVASSTGGSGAAIITGLHSTIEVGPTCLGAATTYAFYWIARPGAVIACRWQGDHPGCKLLVADDLKLKDGELVSVLFGEVTRIK